MGKRNDDLFQLRETSRDEFVAVLRTAKFPQDSFAKTFRAKADAFDLWPCLGAWNKVGLLGAISWTIGKREPTANLQLLHTFYDFRRQGVARALCLECLRRARDSGATFFRVSSEPESRGFYESLGVVFLGRQKSGCLLSIGRIVGKSFGELDYSLQQSTVNKAVYRKGKGGCVEVFNEKSLPG